MKRLSIECFLECYEPVINTIPSPDSILKKVLGNVIWDTREYNLLANNLNSKNIWSIWEYNDKFMIIPGINYQKASLYGYIITDKPYHKNDISNLSIVITKE